MMGKVNGTRKIIGSEVVRLDGTDKVTGRTKFFGDLKMEGMCHAKLVHLPVAHANIIKIDTTEAENYPGVVTVATAKDIPGVNRHGLVTKDQQCICDTKVRYAGDFIAIVVAETEEIAAEAVKLVHVDYEALPVYRTPEESLAPDAVTINEEFEGNIILNAGFEKGNVEEAFATAAHVVENVYKTPHQLHAYLEPEVCVARPMGDGIELWCPIQNGPRARRDLVNILNMPLEKIRIHSTPLGGGFGGKDSLLLQGAVSTASLKCRRPVMLTLNREESFKIAPKRLPIEIWMKTATDEKGKVVAHEVKMTGMGGAYNGYAGAVIMFAMENAFSCYYTENFKINARLVATNNAFSSAFRGFGNLQSNFAVESQMDLLAAKLGIDRLEIRKINCATDKFVYEQTISAKDQYAIKTMEAAENSNVWKTREEWKKQAPYPWIKRGVGIASAQHGNGIGSVIPKDTADVHLCLGLDGRLTVKASSEDMGQGSVTTMAIIAAEAMHMPLSNIDVVNGDTALAPDCGPITASRTTYIAGNAILDAAKQLNREIAKVLNVSVEELKGEGNTICGYTFAQIAAMLEDHVRTKMGFAIFMNAPEKFEFGVHYMTTQVTQVAAVEVDTLTGRVHLIKQATCPASGTVVNKLGYEGQCEGGIVQGFGYAVTENYAWTDEAKPATKNFQTYLIPTMADIPEVIEIIPVDDEVYSGPYGARGLGEPVLVPAGSAVANAVCDALGTRIFSLPYNQDRVLKACRDKKQNAMEVAK